MDISQELLNKIMTTANVKAHEWKNIKGAFRQYSKEDLSQEFILHILELVEQNGKDFIKKIDNPSYMMTVIDGYAKDMIRNYQRHNPGAYSLTDEESGEDSRNPWTIDKSSGDFIDDVALDDFVSQYKKGTPERGYIDFYLEKAGIRHTGMTPRSDGKESGYTDSALARMLGFPGTASSGFKSLKYKMDKEIHQFITGQEYHREKKRARGRFTNK